MAPYFAAAIIILGPPVLYLAFRSRDFRKFLAGAFFVSAGVHFYLYLVDVPVPLLGTDAVQTPDVSRSRSIIHFMFFLLTFYFGYIRKPTPPSPPAPPDGSTEASASSRRPAAPGA